MAHSGGITAIGSQAGFNALGGTVGLKFNGTSSYAELTSNIVLHVGDVLSFEYYQIYRSTAIQYVTDSKGGTSNRCALYVNGSSNNLIDGVGVFGPASGVVAVLRNYAFTNVALTVATQCNLGIFGARFNYDAASISQGMIRNIKLNGTPLYITQTSDYGSASLIDHSGAGNNGTLVNTAWTWDNYIARFDAPTLWYTDVATPLTAHTTGVVFDDVSSGGVTFSNAKDNAGFTLTLKGRSRKVKWTIIVKNAQIQFNSASTGKIIVDGLTIARSIQTDATTYTFVQAQAATMETVVNACTLIGDSTSFLRCFGNVSVVGTSMKVTNCIVDANHQYSVRCSVATTAAANEILENNIFLADCNFNLSTATANIQLRNNYATTYTNMAVADVFSKCASEDATGSEANLRSLTASKLFINTFDNTKKTYYMPRRERNILSEGVDPTLTSATTDYYEYKRPLDGYVYIGAKNKKVTERNKGEFSKNILNTLFKR